MTSDLVLDLVRLPNNGQVDSPVDLVEREVSVDAWDGNTPLTDDLFSPTGVI